MDRVHDARRVNRLRAHWTKLTEREHELLAKAREKLLDGFHLAEDMRERLHILELSVQARIFGDGRCRGWLKCLKLRCDECPNREVAR